MNEMAGLAGAKDDQAQTRIIRLAVLAVGGQGGGVLANWIEALARAQGYDCQTTSVAGVAQRTGSTIYYIEMAPSSARVPVFSLAPAAGDVDVVIGAELMETGRAIMRGFVTPDRTTLIGSTHRVLAISEKTAPGDGEISPAEVLAAAEMTAQRLILADLDKLATENGSVISASLFGALAGSEGLPFPRAAFEDAIRAGGRGVEASLRAFAAAHDLINAGAAAEPEASISSAAPEPPEVSGPPRLVAGWQELAVRIAALPEPARKMAIAGLGKVVDFQGLGYGRDYLDRVEAVAGLDHGKGQDLTREAAKYIANAMAYDDVIRVADLKTRGSRGARVRREMGVDDGAVMAVTEFMHPRAEEIVGLLPAGFGARLADDPKWMARLDRWFNKGRRIRTDRFGGFLLLHALGGLRGWRLRSLRHAQETAHLQTWLALATDAVGRDYDLAVEILRCRRLIKGYSDTHARGTSRFDRVIGSLKLLEGREDAADWLRRLREAALQDEHGKALDGALKTVESFAQDPSGTA